MGETQLMWKPIETAPLDDQILMANFANIDGEIVFCWAASGFFMKDNPKPVWVDFTDAEYSIYNKQFNCPSFENVTHWMPIPKLEDI
jgi:hypothetical protein